MTKISGEAYVGEPGQTELFNAPNDVSVNIDGRDGSDWIIGFNHNDLLIGGLGRDLIRGFDDNDVIFGDQFSNDETQNPNQSLAAEADAIFGERGRDTIFAGGGNNFVNGGQDADFIWGGSGNELLDGGSGDDNVSGQAGNDKLFGGTDTQARHEAFLSSNIGTLTFSFNGTDNTPLSTSQDTSSYGSFDLAVTGTGADTLDGGSGNDSIDGGDGNDLLTGGLGYDRFIFACSNSTANADHITDFKHAVDKIVLDHTYYSKLAVGALSSSAFKDIASGTIDSNDRILYDHNSGRLYYDADGSGSASAHQFATLDNKPPVLTASDFSIVS